MQVANVDALEAGVFGHFLAKEGMAARGGGKIIQVEVRIKCQETVGDLRVQVGEIVGNGSDFNLVHITRDQKGAGDERRWFRPAR
jgi:hypothetical protein